MNELQKKEFDILKVFVEICEQLGLTYYLVCGSALGAVKYGGFIPWDDDVDVGLPRPDYEVFLEKAPEFLPDHIFLQSWRSEKNYPQIFAKLRDCNTTFIEKTASGINMNHGIYIDVFPLDGYPVDTKVQRSLERRKLWYKRFLACNFTYESGFLRKIVYKMFRVLGLYRWNAFVLSKYEKAVTNYPVDGSIVICNHGNWQGKLEYAPAEQYGKGALAVFEGLPVRVPELYDAYLTQKYGDWREDPPRELQAGHHYCAVCDTQRPYSAYIEPAENGRIRITRKK